MKFYYRYHGNAPSNRKTSIFFLQKLYFWKFYIHAQVWGKLKIATSKKFFWPLIWTSLLCTSSCANAKVAVKTMIKIKGCFNKDLQNFIRKIFELFNDNSKIKGRFSFWIIIKLWSLFVRKISQIGKTTLIHATNS